MMNDEVDYCFNLIKRMYRAKRYVDNKVVGPKTFFAIQDELLKAMLMPHNRKVMFRIQKLINTATYRAIGEEQQEIKVGQLNNSGERLLSRTITLCSGQPDTPGEIKEIWQTDNGTTRESIKNIHLGDHGDRESNEKGT